MGSVECSEMLGCTPQQIEDLARSGEIPGLKFGRSWLFMRDDLLVFLAEKAREEARERRAKRQPSARLMTPEPRRQVPPVLPSL